jgi:hypothetical protein
MEPEEGLRDLIYPFIIDISEDISVIIFIEIPELPPA